MDAPAPTLDGPTDAVRNKNERIYPKQRVNAVDITRPEQWFHAVQKSRGKPLQLTIIRNKQEQTLTLTPADSHHTRGALELPSALGDDFSFDNDIAVNPAELDALFANALDNLDALTTQLSQQLNTLQ